MFLPLDYYDIDKSTQTAMMSKAERDHSHHLTFSPKIVFVVRNKQERNPKHDVILKNKARQQNKLLIQTFDVLSYKQPSI